jgi:hypothetical protein
MSSKTNQGPGLADKQDRRQQVGVERRKTASKPAPVKTTVHHDAPSKPQTHRSDANKPGPTHFVAVPHHDSNSGYEGKFVPATPAAKKASAKLAKLNAPLQYPI